MVKLGDIHYRIENYGSYCEKQRYEVVKITPKGYRVARKHRGEDCPESKSFLVLHDANIRYAHPTVDEAISSFIIRKTREKQHVERRLEVVSQILEEKDKINKLKEIDFVLAEQEISFSIDIFNI